MVSRLVKLPKGKSFFIFGPRQVGKSTLLKNTFNDSECIYYDFLKTELYEKFKTEPNLFREEIVHRNKKKNIIVIDEIQRIPELLNEVHYLMEEDKSLVFAISGSSARKLKRSHANMLGGRALTYKLYPFTHIELGKDFNLNKALNLGTLPSIYLEKDTEIAKALLGSYAETYLEEEIKAEAIVRNIGSFLRFLRFAASENGNIINYSNISRETATKSSDVKEYLQILEDTLIGFHLLAYVKSARKRLMRHPKFYFFDTGVQRVLAKRIYQEPVRYTTEYGRLFEHFIVKEIIHLSHYKNKNYEFSFFRTENGAEVDLVIETPDDKVFALEIKANTNPRLSDLKGLKSFKEVYPKSQLLCASLSENEIHYENVTVYPWREIFKAIGLI
ncbi:MAG: ATP-binding protein [Candidatus Melainabacteria bacterium]|nr:ATP-binding protein [Candidatus Melainabacteria bacterium]